MIRTIAAAIFLSIASSGHAATFWEEDFENHLYPNWTGGGNCITSGSPDGVACNYPRITTAQAYNGTHSLLSHYATQGVQDGTFMDRTYTTTRTVWTRQYIKWQNFTFGPENNKLFFAFGDAGSANVIWIHQVAGNELHALVNHTTTVTCPNSFPDSTCNYPPNLATVEVNDNQWHCVETHQSLGTSGVANGSLDLYIDGTQTLHYGSLLMDTNNAPMRYVRAYAQYGLGDRYQDDWAVGDTRIGCDGGGEPEPPASTGGSMDVKVPDAPTMFVEYAYTAPPPQCPDRSYCMTLKGKARRQCLACQ